MAGILLQRMMLPAIFLVMAGCGGGGDGAAVNRRPVALVMPVAATTTASLVQLDGSKSSDPDGDLLLYAWTFASLPPGSKTIIINPNSATPTFIPDVAGTYTVALAVSDGQLISIPAQTSINVTVLNVAPVAAAGPAQTVSRNAAVQLDGTGSHDDNGDALTYSWTFVGRPPGSTAILAGANTARPTFVADQPGQYEVNLEVSDSVLVSQRSNVIVNAVNTLQPVAVAGPDITTEAGVLQTLDGSASYDPYGGPLEYFWRLKSAPPYTDNPTWQGLSPITQFLPDRIGNYVIELYVNRPDGEVSQPDSMQITVPGVRIRMQAAFSETYDYVLPFTSVDAVTMRESGPIFLENSRSYGIVSVGEGYKIINVSAVEPTGTVTPSWNVTEGQAAGGTIIFSSTKPPVGKTVQITYSFTEQKTGGVFKQVINLIGQ
ncbi:MAG: PKD domain-containing protein [Fluviicoccus sp.]|uniref:PKD domain-containing protein n=1 Tax=Fluviicoccus sp. TaxID=2003552 RepID=UPI0027293318|nr:PKD domain-containing protein [Fluviicoccus sp.]MDO8330972.1 PKD domain-containing protein [Fluviicoccus sp.]